MAQSQAARLNFEDLPDILPVFPLADVLLLPNGNLPLNIFEPRYLAMIDDALATNRLIGMIQIQPEVGSPPKLQRVGCAGRITQFTETNDGRYLVTLSGLWRFAVQKEVGLIKGYRRVRPDWQPFAQDMNGLDCLDLDRDRLRDLMRSYLAQHDLHIDCKQLDGASDAKLITALSMICPFAGLDKQALLEAPCCRARAQMFMAMLEIATHNGVSETLTARH
jgi:Lon protease-like protein